MTDATFAQHTIALATGPVTYLKGGTGRPILHLHPAGGPRVTPAMRILAQRHTIYVPTTPGFNGTPEHAAVASMPALADLAAGVVRATIGGPCDVVAESFGGWAALWLAARHPDLVEQLVVQAPAGLRTEGTGGFPSNDPADRHRRLYAVPERAPPPPAPEAAMQNLQAYARYTGGVTLDTALQEALPAVKARTLMLLGTLDEVVPVDTARRLLAGIPQARLTYIYGAAHAPEFDQPEKVARLIGAFMELGEGYVVRRPAA